MNGAITRPATTEDAATATTPATPRLMYSETGPPIRVAAQRYTAAPSAGSRVFAAANPAATTGVPPLTRFTISVAAKIPQAAATAAAGPREAAAARHHDTGDLLAQHTLEGPEPLALVEALQVENLHVPEYLYSLGREALPEARKHEPGPSDVGAAYCDIEAHCIVQGLQVEPVPEILKELR